MARKDLGDIQMFWLQFESLRRQNNGWRLGQAMFNHLYSKRPDLADRIRDTELDPFYDDSLCPATEKWIWENW